MDKKKFYPSITREILVNSITFAKAHTEITDKEIRTILHCCKSLLFLDGEPWKKKDTHDCFDVMMSSFDGAEVCELVGILILILMLLQNSNKRTADRARK